MIFRCRTTIPTMFKWVGVEAESPEQAASDYHFAHDEGSIRHIVEDADGRHVVLFARIEVEGYGTLISRVYSYGIWRKGGVKVGQPSLADIARKLEYMDDPQTLLEPGWKCEESMEDARRRSR